MNLRHNNKMQVSTLRSLKHYWQQAIARIRHPSKGQAQHAPLPEELEQEISAVSSENRSLSAELGRVRSDFEHARSEEDRKIAALEQVREQIESAHSQDRQKLTELERVSAELDRARQAEDQRLAELEQRIASLESERDRAREEARSLGASLSATREQLDSTDKQLRALQSNSEEQAQTFTASLSEATSRIEDTENYVRTVEKDAEDRHRHYSGLIHEMQIAQRRQDQRFNRSLIAAGVALLLGTAAGVILIRDVQNNARLLASMSSDMKALMASIDQRPGLQEEVTASSPPPATPALARSEPVPALPEPATPPDQAASPSKPKLPALPEKSKTVTPRKLPVNPYMLGSSFKRARQTTREGIPQTTRKQSSEYFTNKATEPGITETPSGLQYRIVNPGSGKIPTLADKVVVDYLAITPDEQIIDETYSAGAPATFSMSEVNPGWREALLQMQEGAEWELYVPPRLATGGGTRKRGMTGFEPTIYLIELKQVIAGVPEAGK